VGIWRLLPGNEVYLRVERGIEGMKTFVSVGVLFLVVAPALGAPALYTFSVTSGSVLVNAYQAGYPWGPTSQTSTVGAMTGTFAITLSNGHAVPGDTFVLENGDLYNPSALVLNKLLGELGMNVIMGGAEYITATMAPGSARFLDFGPLNGNPLNGPEPGGTIGLTPTNFSSDTWLQGTITYTGGTTGNPVNPLLLPTTVYDAWAGFVEPFSASFSESGGVITANLTGLVHRGIGSGGNYGNLDFLFTVQGTAPAVPEPTLCGLMVLAVGGGGAWFRRRRM
jgi:hypothetical protein